MVGAEGVRSSVSPEVVLRQWVVLVGFLVENLGAEYLDLEGRTGE